MSKPVVVIPPAPGELGVLHVDTETGKFGPVPMHDVGHEQHESQSINTIRRLAYAMWEARGGAHGSSEVDWLAAEREVLGLHANSAKTGGVGAGLQLTNASGRAETQEGVTNPNDGRGPLRASDDEAYDRPPPQKSLKD